MKLTITHTKYLKEEKTEEVEILDKDTFFQLWNYRLIVGFFVKPYEYSESKKGITYEVIVLKCNIAEQSIEKFEIHDYNLKSLSESDLKGSKSYYYKMIFSPDGFDTISKESFLKQYTNAVENIALPKI